MAGCRIRHGVDHDEIRLAAVGDEALRSRQVPAIAVAAGTGLHVGRIRSGGRFGQAEGAQDLAGGAAGQPARALAVAAAQQDRVGCKVVRRQRRHGRATGARHDLHRAQKCRGRDAGAAMRLGQVGPQKAKSRQPFKLRADEGGGLVRLCRAGNEFFGRVAFKHVGEGAFLGAKHMPAVGHVTPPAMIPAALRRAMSSGVKPRPARMPSASPPRPGATSMARGFTPSKRTG